MFDEKFETVYADENEPPPTWEDMCIFQRFQVEFEEGMPIPTLSDEWLSPEEAGDQQVQRRLAELRGGRRLCQDLQSRETREDLSYKPPPPPKPVLLPDHRQPPDKQELIVPRELSKWIRSGSSAQTPPPSTQQPAPSPAKSQQQPTPRRNPSRHATRQPLNVTSFSGSTYEFWYMIIFSLTLATQYHIYWQNYF